MDYLLYFSTKSLPLISYFLLNFCLVSYAQQRSQSDNVKVNVLLILSCSTHSDVSSSYLQLKLKHFSCSIHSVISVSSYLSGSIYSSHSPDHSCSYHASLPAPCTCQASFPKVLFNVSSALYTLYSQYF